ncbi:hypothetical protein GA0116948_11692 [Chitinophaga costaii]|uniref:Uncharacterized protein n=1 Tax=Chitinophaga costaii TaxID=1335309 RepID=A0A1C4FRT5_9BACT|nr:hypothetical protein [Chitinophaga costaii]PUZ20506.1 hypothetical protein DCM91_18920 [Chitinophaga costaii]SCC58747.1 hypothetical protein GA0116948_11692 [Chitinophaga costaii]
MLEKEINQLQDIHQKLVALATIFRQKVCEECKWSTPTFYRKMRESDKFSNAEKEKIVSIMIQVTMDTQNYFKKYYP